MERANLKSGASVMKAMVVDSYALFCKDARARLTRGGHDVLCEAHSLEEALLHLSTFYPDLALIGPNVTPEEALALCRTIAGQPKPIRTVVVTTHPADALFQADAANAGALACLDLDATPDEWHAAVDAAIQGGLLFAPQVLSLAVRPILLTRRERQVLALIRQGKSDREVAQTLGIQSTTVRAHARHVLGKLGVSDRHEAVVRAHRRGLI